MKLIIILLTAMTVSLLLVGCGGGGGSGGSSSGGGTDNRSGDNGVIGGDNRSGDNGVIGDDNRSGDGGIIDGDGNGGELNIPAQAEWTIVPLAGGLSIQWHNLNNFTQMNAPQRLNINLTRSDTSVKQTHTIDVSDFINGVYQLTGLEDGIAYKFASMIELEYGGNISHSRPILLLLEFNRLDNIGNGIVVGVDNDRNGRADSIDDDDDNDEPVLRCQTPSDCDGDGHNDDVDIDDDGDGLIEIGTAAELDAVRWVLNGTGFKANETAMLDQTGCGNSSAIRDCSGYELVNNISLTDYIAETYPTNGWLPIAHNRDTITASCDGETFGGIFEGNGFVVSDLRINRQDESCIALFGHVSGGTIRNVGVLAREVVGTARVGGLAGSITFTEIINSYAVVGVLEASSHLGGLVGELISAKVINSHAVSGVMMLSSIYNGGLVGTAGTSTIINSYAITTTMVNNALGGLVGDGRTSLIVNSYAISESLEGPNFIGGLAGRTTSSGTKIIYSYVLSGMVNGNTNVGGLVGSGASVTASYWNNETSGRNDDTATGSSGHNSLALYSPTNFTGLYDTWDDGAMVEGINDNATIWCDEDASGMIEDEERLENNKVWDFGTNTDYPALRCTGDSLADQRAWWYLNTTSHKPQLNTTRLNAYLDGTLP